MVENISNCKDYHTIAVEKPILICKDCEEEIYLCQGCEDYIFMGDKIVCALDNFHYHEQCFEDMKHESDDDDEPNHNEEEDYGDN